MAPDVVAGYMSPIAVFLSVVCAVRNQAQELPEALERLTQTLCYLVSDYELIIVDNACDDETVQLLKELTDSSGYPNIHVFALTKWVEDDVASWARLENSLGDFAVVTGFDKEQVELIPKMLEKVDLLPEISTMSLMRFPSNLREWRSRNEEAIHRRTNH